MPNNILNINSTNVSFRLHIFQFQLHKKGITAHYFKAWSDHRIGVFKYYRAKFKFIRQQFPHFNEDKYYSITLYIANTIVCLVTNIPGGRMSRPVGRREEVTCHPETRDHRCDMRSGRCHGDHGSSCRCQILLGQRQRNCHGIYKDSFIHSFIHLFAQNHKYK